MEAEVGPMVHYFKSSLPLRGSLGPMAVSGRTSSMPLPTPKPSITPTQTITPTATPEITPTYTPVTWTGVWNEKVPGFQALTAVITLIALYTIGRKRD